MRIVDPLRISKLALPMIVLSDDTRSFFGWAIKNHTHGLYNHIMIMINPQKVVTQGLTYKEIPITKYMEGKHRLKFWQPDLSGEDKLRMIEAVEKDLKKPFWRKGYDFLGIFGQSIKVRWIQNPWKEYCSEVITKYLRMFFVISKRRSPAELNRICGDLEGVKYYGHWIKD